MTQHIKELEIPGVLLIQPRVFSDARGSFHELWNRDREEKAGFAPHFVQDNLAISKHRVLRGLHFQLPHPQGKYVTVTSGTIYDVAVDLRSGSPFFGRWLAVELSAASGQAVYLPPGFAHGYQVLSAEAAVVYKCTDYYHADCDRSIVWNDLRLNVDWPLADPILSEKDQRAPTLDEVSRQLGLRASA